MTRGQIKPVASTGAYVLRADHQNAASIERGFLKLRSGPVDVGDVLESSLALIEPPASQRGIRIVPVGPRGGVVVVQADARAPKAARSSAVAWAW